MGEDAGGVVGQPRARGGGEGAEKRDIKWADRGKRFGDEDGAGVQHLYRGARLYSGGICVR